jgi:hypothetical protein
LRCADVNLVNACTLLPIKDIPIHAVLFNTYNIAILKANALLARVTDAIATD